MTRSSASVAKLNTSWRHLGVLTTMGLEFSGGPKIWGANLHTYFCDHGSPIPAFIWVLGTNPKQPLLGTQSKRCDSGSSLALLSAF